MQLNFKQLSIIHSAGGNDIIHADIDQMNRLIIDLIPESV